MPRNKYRTLTTLPPASQFGRGESIIYNGEVLTSDGVNWTSQTGPLSYTAETMPDPTVIGAGATVVVDGKVLEKTASGLSFLGHSVKKNLFGGRSVFGGQGFTAQSAFSYQGGYRYGTNWFSRE